MARVHRVRLRICATARGELGANEALGGAGIPGLDRLLAEIRTRIRHLVEAAQGAGEMRRDITWRDVAFLLAGVSTDTHTIGLRADTTQWSRNLRIVLDGLRARNRCQRSSEDEVSTGDD